MHDDSSGPIPRVVMDTSVLPVAEQFAYWAAHTRGARLFQPEPGPFLCRGDMWNLGALQMTLVDVDPFVAVRDRALVNAVDADYIQYCQLLDGTMTFEADGATAVLTAPAAFLRDSSRPSTVTATRTRCLILYFARGFLEEVTGPIDFQGPLAPVAELTLLRDVGVGMIGFFPDAAASAAPLYAAILRDLAAAAMLRAGAIQRTGASSLLAAAKDHVATQPPGTLSIEGITAALGVSRSVVYRLFERDGGVLAYDRMRRLRALHRAVSNPRNTSTLAELARRYGFRDPAALSRSFRKAFGATPEGVRRRHADFVSGSASSAPFEIRRAFDSFE